MARDAHFPFYGRVGPELRDHTAPPVSSKGAVEYLRYAVSRHFCRPATRGDVIWSYACVRPLYDDGKGRADEATRDQILTPDTTGMEAPLLSAFGGKIMTDRRLTEASLAKLAPHFYRLRRLWIAGDDFSGRQP